MAVVCPSDRESQDKNPQLARLGMERMEAHGSERHVFGPSQGLLVYTTL